jgi:hypothetical protein
MNEYTNMFTNKMRPSFKTLCAARHGYRNPIMFVRFVFPFYHLRHFYHKSCFISEDKNRKLLEELNRTRQLMMKNSG